MLLLSLVQLSRMPSTGCVVLVSEAPMAPKAVRKSQLPSWSARLVVLSNSVAFSSRIRTTCLVTMLFDKLAGDHQPLSQYHSMLNVGGVILVAVVRGACAVLSLCGQWRLKVWKACLKSSTVEITFSEPKGKVPMKTIRK